MEEAEFLGHIFKCDIVRDNVLFQSGRERFSENRLGVKIMAFVRCCDKQVRAQLAFCGQRTGARSPNRREAQDIVGELAVQKADAILAGDFEFCSIAEVKEHGRGEF